jgi:long-chain acyl-CoA synthetase
LHPRIRSHIEEHIESVNARLSPHEAVRRFAILPRDFTEASGEVTPTLKIRRREITRSYQEILDSLYDQPSPSRQSR